MIFCSDPMVKEFDREIPKFPELLPEQEMTVRSNQIMSCHLANEL